MHRCLVSVLGCGDGVSRFLEEQFDPYIALRMAYLQRRQSLVGNPPAVKYEIEE